VSRARVKSAIFVAAYRRGCEAQGAFVTVGRVGDDDAGLVMIRAINRLGEERLLMEAANFSGSRIWRDLSDGFQPSDSVNKIIDQQLRFDSDLWVVDIEHPDGDCFLQEPIVTKDFGG